MVNSKKIMDSPQCQFFVLRKKRLCRMTVRPGRQYCGEHEPPPEPGDEVDQRVPCPNDPKHTVYISKMEKHLSKCNARKTADPPYIEYNVNAPADPHACPRVPLKDVPKHMLDAVIKKINTIYGEHIKASITIVDPLQPHHPVVAADIAQADRGDSSRRHLRQVSRILQLAEAHGLPPDTCYLEMGAGKGAVSYYAAAAWCGGGGRVLAVERGAARHKRDARAPAARRLRADLAHVAAARLPAAAAAPAIYGLAKHLCGVATDYGLRCITAAGVLAKCAGCVLATCCHHRCELHGYLAAQHLQELGISREELNIIFSVVSWATCGDGRPRHAHHTGQHHNDTTGEHTHDNTHHESDDSIKERDDDETSRKHVHNNETRRQHANDNEADSDTENETRELADNELSRGHVKHIETNREHEHNETSRAHDHETSREHAEDSETMQDHEDMSEDHDNPSCELDSIERSPSDDAAMRARREAIGRRAKAVVDWGRVLYLRDRGFTASLVQYVPATDSLENMCIVAHKPVRTSH